MITARLTAEDDFEGWRDQCRGLLRLGARPADIVWQVGEQKTDLFANPGGAIETSAIGVPKGFADLSRTVICHSDPERFGLLYQLLTDLKARRSHMGDQTDPLLRKLEMMAKTVRRDIHKMRAFVRFRRVEQNGTEHYIAWFEPEHHIVRTNAAFFVRRFAGMQWSILTPQLSIHWDKDRLHEGPPARKEDAPNQDVIEDQWKTYYGSIFNPARLKVKAMLKEMPKKYWHNMPETALVSELIQSARGREIAMIEKEIEPSATDTLAALRVEAKQCRRCPLHGPATQLVFGEGPEKAKIMFVGEQPGDQEDKAGRPFVGPAGQLFNAALAQAGVDRSQAYVTNAVKHFKFKSQGKRRIHDKPNVGEINHCRWWLKREIDLLQPELIVALGATAARSLIGKNIAITANRGQIFESIEGVPVLVTIHPSYLLRLPDAETAQLEREQFIADLASIKDRVRDLQIATR
jgi:probable DNA metabolism protein